MADRPERQSEPWTQADSEPRKRSSPAAVLAVVGFGVFIAADDLTVVSTMLRPIIGDLGIVLPDGLDDAAWIVNAYLIAYVAVMPFAGRLSDVIGRRKVFMGAMGLFLAGSIIIPYTTSLGPFLFGRVLTALGGGTMVPVGLAVVGDVYAEGRRARALGLLGAIDTMGWVWGPLYGAMLVRFLSWHWQFYLNWPLAIVGMVAAWKVLGGVDEPARRARIDWAGAGTLTAALVALNLALLGSAEIQSITGLDELTGSTGESLRWFYLVAAVALAAFVWIQRTAVDPLIDGSLFSGRNLSAAVAVNFLVGAALVIAMVDVPLFVNVIALDVERSAVISGWLLAALTAAMALTSYIGGRITERTWYRPPVIAGLVAAGAAFVMMGAGWGVDTAGPGVAPVPGYAVMAAHLALLGLGFGLVIAPTSAAVVDGAPADRRGTAASLVIVMRLIGLSVGLSALTAWGLYRFNQLRPTVVLPPVDDPGFAEAVGDANASLTTGSLAGTFAAAAVVLAVAAAVALMMRRNAAHGHGPDEKALVGPALPPPKETRMKDAVNRHLVAVLAVVAALAAASLVANMVLAARVGRAEDKLARVEAGAALFAAQVQGFQSRLAELAPAVSAGLDEAVQGLETFRTSTIEVEVPIDETLPINTVIVLDRTIDVPIRTTLPIDQTFDTTITVAGPFGIDVPLDVSVPVNVEVPVDLVVPIAINESIPISTEVAVQLTVPISIEVAGTELADLAASLEAGLRSFAETLASLSGS